MRDFRPSKLRPPPSDPAHPTAFSALEGAPCAHDLGVFPESCAAGPAATPPFREFEDEWMKVSRTGSTPAPLRLSCQRVNPWRCSASSMTPPPPDWSLIAGIRLLIPGDFRNSTCGFGTRISPERCSERNGSAKPNTCGVICYPLGSSGPVYKLPLGGFGSALTGGTHLARRKG